MKRFYLNLTLCFLSLLLVFGCSIEGTGLPGTDSGHEAELPDFDSELEDDDEEMLFAEQEAAVFISGKFISQKDIEFEFSSPVRIISLSFEPSLEIGLVEEGSTVKVSLEEETGPAIKLTAELEVEDAWENVLSLQVALVSRNNDVPDLIINELRTEYSKPRAEFIEFKILSDGNLGALRVFAASNNLNPVIYEFAPVEVKAGEYVVLHLRTLEDSCIDEYGDNLNESGGSDSCPSARDFWIPDSTKLLRKTDAVYVLDQDDKALAAVMISETPDSAWNKDYFEAAAVFLFNQGAWQSPTGGICSPADAVSSAEIKTSATRSISRDEAAENTFSSADWYVTITGGATPGFENNPTRF